MASFSVEAMVRGYHVYKDIWTAVVGEEFPCKRETGDTFDPFAVAVMRGDNYCHQSHSEKDLIHLLPLFAQGLGRSLRFEASAK